MAVVNQDETELIQFILCTGVREQEAEYATWRDVDFEEKTYTVREKLDMGFTPKDKEEGSIPIPDLLVQPLKARRERRSNSRLIFPRPNGKAEGHLLRVIKELPFEAAFREYGMPWAVRSDNGPPFASCAVAGLSRLSVWWIKLGIMPQRIEAGHPEQNGRHERMHRTLKEATALPPKANRRAQQRAFDEFRREYNEVRPHQALAMETPESVYRSSPRPFPGRVPEPEYDTAMKVRRVFKQGQFFINQHDVFLSKVLSGARIGLLPIDDRYQRIYLAWNPIARLDTRTMRVEKLWQEDRTSEAEACGKEEIPKSGDSHLPTGTTTARR
ncbi:MAG: integrase core domain-containing protein [Terracidiphilus sp.]|nr:integrase core domain-containing protein [Terracidiphilus sp.]